MSRIRTFNDNDLIAIWDAYDTVPEVAKALGVHPLTIYRHSHRLGLAHKRPNRKPPAPSPDTLRTTGIDPDVFDNFLGPYIPKEKDDAVHPRSRLWLRMFFDYRGGIGLTSLAQFNRRYPTSRPAMKSRLLGAAAVMTQIPVDKLPEDVVEYASKPKGFRPEIDIYQQRCCSPTVPYQIKIMHMLAEDEDLFEAFYTEYYETGKPDRWLMAMTVGTALPTIWIARYMEMCWGKMTRV